MLENEFWTIVAESRAGASEAGFNFEGQVAELRGILASKPAREIVDFVRIFQMVYDRAYRRDLWAAATLITMSCPDDGFSDFRSWLVSMGRETYERALRDPDSLVEVADDPTVECFFFEDFPGIHPGLTGVERIPKRVAPELTGPRWTFRDLPPKLPRLWRKYGAQFLIGGPLTDEIIVD